jgi:hypothetical protein
MEPNIDVNRKLGGAVVMALLFAHGVIEFANGLAG